MKRLLIVWVVFAPLGIIACKKASTNSGTSSVDPTVCENTNYTYTDDIKIIIDAKCATSGCHDGGEAPNYLGYANSFKFKSGIQTTSLNSTEMPKGGLSLSQTEKELLQCWINGGAPE